MTELPPHVKWVDLNAPTGETGKFLSEAPESVFVKMLRGIKGVIFDFDGTLYDKMGIGFRLVMSRPTDSYRIWKERYVRAHLAGNDYLSSEQYYNAFFKEMAGKTGRPQERMRKWYFNRYMPRMVRILKKYFDPRPGTDELLQRLGNRESPVKTAVYSDYPFLKRRFEALGLTIPQKLHFYDPETFGALKPAVRPFLQIANNFGLSPSEILVIGDREDTDGLGAFNAGMHFFCLETGRKHHFRFDPNRPKREEPQGPTLLMYAGNWDQLCKLLLEKVSDRTR